MINILGIDCASQLKNTGFSIGIYKKGQLIIKDALVGSKFFSLEDVVLKWFNPYEINLIAIDAPLGWPMDMALNLNNHFAGQLLDIEANQMFRRETDRFVKRKTNKQPLDVGADKIARAALAGLKLIGDISSIIKEPIPLAWEPLEIQPVSVIEVYPSLTLFMHAIISKGYKKKENQLEREEIISQLEHHIDLQKNKDIMLFDVNVLDSVVCLLSALDFINGNVELPENYELAKKEGWIWFKKDEEHPVSACQKAYQKY